MITNGRKVLSKFYPPHKTDFRRDLACIPALRHHNTVSKALRASNNLEWFFLNSRCLLGHGQTKSFWNGKARSSGGSPLFLNNVWSHIPGMQYPFVEFGSTRSVQLILHRHVASHLPFSLLMFEPASYPSLHTMCPRSQRSDYR